MSMHSRNEPVVIPAGTNVTMQAIYRPENHYGVPCALPAALSCLPACLPASLSYTRAACWTGVVRVDAVRAGTHIGGADCARLRWQVSWRSCSLAWSILTARAQPPLELRHQARLMCLSSAYTRVSEMCSLRDRLSIPVLRRHLCMQCASLVHQSCVLTEHAAASLLVSTALCKAAKVVQRFLSSSACRLRGLDSLWP